MWAGLLGLDCQTSADNASGDDEPPVCRSSGDHTEPGKVCAGEPPDLVEAGGAELGGEPSIDKETGYEELSVVAEASDDDVEQLARSVHVAPWGPERYLIGDMDGGVEDEPGGEE